MPWQFSAWNESDTNRKKLLNVDATNSVFQDALTIAERAVNGTLTDNTGGATHYHVERMKKYPKWKDDTKVVARIGSHIFYKGIK